MIFRRVRRECSIFRGLKTHARKETQMSNFNTLKTVISAQFARMQQHPMFRVEVDRDALWQTYLSSFPAGTNQIYRERTEYDCSSCRQFVKAVGDVVALIDGALVSVWSVRIPNEPAFQTVMDAMASLVLSKPISSPFLHYERTAGVDKNFEQLDIIGTSSPEVRTWSHFFVNIPHQYVKPKADIPTLLSEKRSTHDVFLRSLQEITLDAIDTVLDLIAQSSLYRGEEHKALLLQFKTAKMEFDSLSDNRAREIFTWAGHISGAVSRIRNTAIGTLLVDLSEGKDIEDAVKSFEAKVAPASYKRPSSLVTKAMIDRAKEKIQELGLTSSLDRRHATLRDITVNNLLFADRTTRAALSGDIFDELASKTQEKANNLDKVEEVPIDRFISEILPRAEFVEVMLENRHQGNLVSLIAPSNPTSPHLFKWGNGFSWSYAGEVADALREKVKKAGGNVTGDLCCRLAWWNRDDLDLHMKEPRGYEIYFGNRHTTSPCGGRLDVDMNVSGETREPVENIFYLSRTTMREGEYHLFVHQYYKRENQDIGFEVELDYLGDVSRFSYDRAVQGSVTVARFHYSHKAGITMIESLPSSQATKTIWNLPTQTFHRVSALMFSPNHWDDRGIGNRHFFFMLQGCKNDGSARGFYNEFLSEELTPHRKVLEVVGAKMKPADSDEQLSGLGFSSTRRDTLLCRVRGSITRTIRITI